MSAFQYTSLLVYYAAAAVPWLFIFYYHRMSRGAWRRDPMGWHIMAITAVDAIIFTMVVFGVWWPALTGQPVWRWAGLVMVAGFPSVTVWRGVILWRIVRERIATGGPGPRRLRHPVKVWQGILAGTQIVLAQLVHGHPTPALFVGAVQLALAAYTLGRARATPTPAISTPTQ